ncbi:uncharacterized protein LOC101238334 isoform X2 [Hydra vulgaris]|uniref:Uncharacterized protein LOC101238334 isoform X2 n=1 Tax=Hydra vulgaris TaxID=6087 RepID=A0ABM4D3Y2_HYDVU
MGNSSEKLSDVNLLIEAQNFYDLVQEFNFIPQLFQKTIAKEALRRYESLWLPLVAEYLEIRLIAPLDIELIWIVHMHNPDAYLEDCMRLYGTLLNHTIGTFEERRENTTAEYLWKKKYPNEPFAFTTTPRKVPFTSKLSSNIIKALDEFRIFCRQVALPHFKDEKFLSSAINEYLHNAQFDDYLKIAYPYNRAFIWKSHMVNPQAYQNDIAYLEEIIDYTKMDQLNSSCSSNQGAMFRGSVAPLAQDETCLGDILKVDKIYVFSITGIQINNLEKSALYELSIKSKNEKGDEENLTSIRFRSKGDVLTRTYKNVKRINTIQFNTQNSQVLKIQIIKLENTTELQQISTLNSQGRYFSEEFFFPNNKNLKQGDKCVISYDLKPASTDESNKNSAERLDYSCIDNSNGFSNAIKSLSNPNNDVVSVNNELIYASNDFSNSHEQLIELKNDTNSALENLIKSSDASKVKNTNLNECSDINKDNVYSNKSTTDVISSITTKNEINTNENDFKTSEKITNEISDNDNITFFSNPNEISNEIIDVISSSNEASNNTDNFFINQNKFGNNIMDANPCSNEPSNVTTGSTTTANETGNSVKHVNAHFNEVSNYQVDFANNPNEASNANQSSNSNVISDNIKDLNTCFNKNTDATNFFTHPNQNSNINDSFNKPNKFENYLKNSNNTYSLKNIKSYSKGNNNTYPMIKSKTYSKFTSNTYTKAISNTYPKKTSDVLNNFNLFQNIINDKLMEASIENKLLSYPTNLSSAHMQLKNDTSEINNDIKSNTSSFCLDKTYNSECNNNPVECNNIAASGNLKEPNTVAVTEDLGESSNAIVIESLKEFTTFVINVKESNNVEVNNNLEESGDSNIQSFSTNIIENNKINSIENTYLNQSQVFSGTLGLICFEVISLTSTFCLNKEGEICFHKHYGEVLKQPHVLAPNATKLDEAPCKYIDLELVKTTTSKKVLKCRWLFSSVSEEQFASVELFDLNETIFASSATIGKESLPNLNQVSHPRHCCVLMDIPEITYIVRGTNCDSGLLQVTKNELEKVVLVQFMNLRKLTKVWELLYDYRDKSHIIYCKSLKVTVNINEISLSITHPQVDISSSISLATLLLSIFCKSTFLNDIP